MLVEPLSGNKRFLDGLANYSRVDTDFAQEYYNETKEANCGEDGDPDEPKEAVAGRRDDDEDREPQGQHPVELALRHRRHGQHGAEIGDGARGLDT